MKSIGENIKYIRKRRKQTQAEFAKEAGISRSYLGDLENNRKNPSLETLNKIAKRIDVTIEELLYGFDPNKLIKDFTKKDYEAFASVLEDRDPKMVKLLKDIKDSDLIGQVSSDLKKKNISMGEVFASGIVSNEKKKIKNVMDEIQKLIDNNKKAKDGFQKTNDTIVKILEVALRELELQYDSLDSL